MVDSVVPPQADKNQGGIVVEPDPAEASQAQLLLTKKSL
jgi:hypothetical protein